MPPSASLAVDASQPPRPARALPWRAWALALSYAAVVSLLHLEFSLWLVKTRVDASGATYSHRTWFPYVLGAIVVALLVLWIARAVRHPRTLPSVIGWWSLWLACLWLADRFMTYSIYEFSHYPQYALLAVLVGRAMDPRRTRWCTGRILFWTTLLGMADELLQYLWIARSYGNYLDFNDFVVNLVAGAAGVMLYYGAAPAPRERELRLRSPEWWAIGVVTALFALGFASGWMHLSPPPGLTVPPGGLLADGPAAGWYVQRDDFWFYSWTEGRHHGDYFVLGPLAGLSLLVLGGLLFGRYAPRAWGRDPPSRP